VSEPVQPPPLAEAVELAATSPASASPPTVSKVLVGRLSLGMLLQFLPPGLWTVTLSSYIGANTESAGNGMFDSSFVGISGVASAIGALASPLLFGALADSWFRTERMIALVNLACAAMLVLLCSLRNQWWFLFAMIAYYQFSAPALTLSYSISLRHLARAKHYFPVVRASGTIGWIIAMWMVGSIVPWWWGVPSERVEASLWPLWLAVGGHLVAAAYSLTLPETHPLSRGTNWRNLLDGCAKMVASNPRLIRFLLVCFCATICAQFYTMFANLYLNNIGIKHAATKLSMGQMVEIVCMLILPIMLIRWGPKRMFVIGVMAWIVRYLCLAYGGPTGLPLLLVYVAILVHGLCYVFVYITAFIYVDHAATPETQSAAQGLLALVTSGLGHLVGSLFSGAMQSVFLTPAGVDVAPYDWRSFFLVAAAGSAVSLLLFWALMGFKREVMPGEIAPDEAV
jgi:nucleoside transporter